MDRLAPDVQAELQAVAKRLRVSKVAPGIKASFPAEITATSVPAVNIAIFTGCSRKTRRSSQQNRYLHAVPLPMLAEHFGYSIPEMKLVLMGECWGWKHDPVSGREIPIRSHTSEMSTEECQWFIDWLIPWAAEKHDFLIPLPNEVNLDEVA